MKETCFLVDVSAVKEGSRREKGDGESERYTPLREQMVVPPGMTS